MKGIDVYRQLLRVHTAVQVRLSSVFQVRQEGASTCNDDTDCR